MGILDKFGIKKGSTTEAKQSETQKPEVLQQPVTPKQTASVTQQTVAPKQTTATPQKPVTPQNPQRSETDRRIEELLSKGRGAYAEGKYNAAIPYFLEAYQLGSPAGANLLGNTYLKGEGCEIDEEKAVACYIYAAERNEQYACAAMGKVYLYGLGGVSIDLNRALQWFEKAVSLGHEWSRPRVYWLRKSLKLPNTIELNDRDVIKLLDFLKEECWFDEYADYSFNLTLGFEPNVSGDGMYTAKYRHALMMLGIWGAHEFREQSNGEFSELEKINFSEAYYWKGNFYRHGWVKEKNYQTALEYYRKAKELGSKQCDLPIRQMEALLADNGRINLDVSALHAKNKNGDAVYDALNEAYRNTDYERMSVIARYLEQHQEICKPSVMSLIGSLYHAGYGCYERDEWKAVLWYRKAIEAGCYDECFKYGMLLERAEGVISNLEEARRAYRLGASMGDAQCRNRLRILGVYEACPNMNRICRPMKPAAKKKTPVGEKKTAEEQTREYIDKGHKARVTDIKGNYKVAFSYFEAAYRVGKSAEAANLLANAYFEGTGCKIDEKRAVELYMFAAENNNMYACYTMGKISISGAGGVEKDIQKALRYFEKAMNLGHHWSRAMVYFLRDKLEMEQNFSMTENDMEDLFEILQEMGLVEDWYYYANEWRKKGNDRAKYLLAVALTGVYGGYTNREYSCLLFDELEDNLYPNASFWMAEYLRYGWDVFERDLSVAMKYYNKAKELGCKNCDNAIEQITDILDNKGVITPLGYNGIPDESVLIEALNEYHPKRFYEKVSAVVKNIEANFNNYSVMPLSAFLYRVGYGEHTRDERKAVEWYRKALENRQFQACYEYGLFLEFGPDTIQDKEEAYRVYAMGANEGDRKCIQRLRMRWFNEKYNAPSRKYDMSWLRTYEGEEESETTGDAEENDSNSEEADWELEVDYEQKGDSDNTEESVTTEKKESKEEISDRKLPENLDSYFEGIVGMESVKQQLTKIYNGVKIKLLRDKSMREKGETPVANQMGYNFIILGNPGTGKTTVARIIAKILYDINIREKDTVEEADRSKLVGEHVGGTEIKVTKLMDKADGGTLIIDEAYSLYREESSGDFGREAIDTLLKEMEERKQTLSVIIAGYKEPMMNMIKNANSGFASRFTYTIDLPDYTEEELIQIAGLIAKEQNCTMGERADEAIRKCIHRDKIDDTFGNARYINELVHKAIQNQAERLQKQTSFDDSELFILKAEDFWSGSFEEKGVKEYLEELNALSGLASVKAEVNSLIQRISVRLEMEKRGLPVTDDLGTLHMTFKGNPGTGKTTVARILGNLYASMGVLKRGDVFVECSRATLVGQYQGHTAANVKKVVQSAMGGILFIDEAYSLVQSPNDSFGREAVDTLVAEMENNRKNLVVIFAGYSKDMDEFFENNQGLRSRVPIELIFEDYSEEELTDICIRMLRKQNFSLEDAQTETTLCAYIKEKAKQKDFGNARGVRNLVDGIIRRQNVRMAALLQGNPHQVTDEMLTMITCQDIN